MSEREIEAVADGIGDAVNSDVQDAAFAALDRLASALAEAERERGTLRDALLVAKDDLRWQSDYAGPDGRAEAQEAISRIEAALAVVRPPDPAEAYVIHEQAAGGDAQTRHKTDSAETSE